MCYVVASTAPDFELGRTVDVALSLLNVSVDAVGFYRVWSKFGWIPFVIYLFFLAFAANTERSGRLLRFSNRLFPRFGPVGSVFASALTFCGFSSRKLQILWALWNACLVCCVCLRGYMERYRRYSVYLWDECCPCFD